MRRCRGSQQFALWGMRCERGPTFGMYNFIDPTVQFTLPPNSGHPEGNFTTVTQEYSIFQRQRLQGMSFSLGEIRALGSLMHMKERNDF